MLKEKSSKTYLFVFFIGLLISLIILLIYLKNTEIKDFAYTNVSYLDYCTQIAKHKIDKILYNNNDEFIYIPKIDQKVRINNKLNKETKYTNKDKGKEQSSFQAKYRDILNSYVKDISGYTVDEMVEIINELPTN